MIPSSEYLRLLADRDRLMRQVLDLEARWSEFHDLPARKKAIRTQGILAPSEVMELVFAGDYPADSGIPPVL